MYLAPVVVKAIEERIVIYNFNTIIIYKKPFHNWKGFFLLKTLTCSIIGWKIRCFENQSNLDCKQ